MSPVFFYGLFMAPSHRPEGMALGRRRVACAKGYRLRIEGRATLVPEPGAEAWGILEDVAEADLQRLYGGEAMALYAPHPLKVALPATGEKVAAVAYVAPLLGTEADASYEQQLRRVMSESGLPPASWQGLGPPEEARAGDQAS